MTVYCSYMSDYISNEPANELHRNTAMTSFETGGGGELHVRVRMRIILAGVETYLQLLL